MIELLLHRLEATGSIRFGPTTPVGTFTPPSDGRAVVVTVHQEHP
ncbi:hypothetical protein ACFYPZ_38585 [Streptomyces sp. NPDC005506]